MTSPDKESLKQAVKDALATITVPDGEVKKAGSPAQDIVGAGLVSAVIVDDEARAGIVLDFGTSAPGDVEALRTAAENAARNVNGITQANVVLTAAKTETAAKTASARPRPDQAGPAPTLKRTPPPPPSPKEIPGIRHIIAVASGKGGVGKSTTSINLALGLKEQGLKTGILDLDIFGPSLPMLLGLDARPSAEDKKIIPHVAHGLTAMSIGFLLDVDQPVVWRGPRVMGATQQLIHEVAWGELDVLVIDMPPGTGDVQLTLVQQAPLSGAVIVSTPQDLALIDARKGLAMFRKVGTPVFGFIENMSYLNCPSCGHEIHVFGHGGAEAAAQELNTPFLGRVPLHMRIRESADAGNPIMVSDPDCPEAAAYRSIARKVVHSLETAEG